jgi:effector-binding domain-containing protein
MALYEVRLRRLPSVAVVRRRAERRELARLVPECCGKVWNVVRAQGTPAGRHVAIYWDDSIRLEVGVELQGPFVDRGDVVTSATPAGLVAMATHFGPYSGLGGAYAAIRQWAAAHQQGIAGPSWEIYGHWMPEWNDDPSKIRTDVCCLVQSVSHVNGSD